MRDGVKNILYGVLAMFICAACAASKENNQLEEAKSLYLNKNYEMAKNALIKNGWSPIRPICSSRKICFEDGVLATNLDKKETCAFFKKEGNEMKFCVELVLDGARIRSVSLVENRK